MSRQILLAASLVALLSSPAAAQDLTGGNARKLLGDVLEQNPGIYFYVCRNGLGQQVLRAARKPLDKPEGFHPDKPPILKDIVLDRAGNALPADGLERLQAACRKHNELAPKAPVAQLKTPKPAKSTPLAGPPAKETAREKDKTSPLASVELKPLDAETTEPGERFSKHAQRLLAMVGGPYEMNGKPVARRPSQEETLQDAEFVLSLTQSKNPDLRQAALLTCSLYALRMQYAGAAASQNANLEVALERRLRGVVDRSLKDGSLDLEKEFELLLRDGEGGIAAESLGDFGKVLGALFITDEFKKHEEQQFRALVIGSLSAAARNHMEKLAGEPAGEAPRISPLDVAVIYDPKDRTFLQIANRTKKPQHHVLIGTRSVADPVYVKKTANMYRVQGKLAEAFDILPQEATAKMPNMVELWEAIQMLDFGSVVYIPELPAGAMIKVELCSNDRLSMTKDVRVSLWSDELVAQNLKASNLTKVLAECRAPPQRQPLAAGKPFIPPIVAPPPASKPKNLAEARVLARKQAEKDKLAAFSLQLAEGALARGDESMAQVYLVQAINVAPDSPGGKKAKKMLERFKDKK